MGIITVFLIVATLCIVTLIAEGAEKFFTHMFSNTKYNIKYCLNCRNGNRYYV